MSAETVHSGAAAPGARPSGVIHDIGYRHYDGPLHTSLFRWWVVARAMVRLSLKKKGFWVLACLALLPYLFPGFQLYLRSRAPAELISRTRCCVPYSAWPMEVAVNVFVSNKLSSDRHRT